jgi:hypothetical protein
MIGTLRSSFRLKAEATRSRGDTEFEFRGFRLQAEGQAVRNMFRLF